MEGLQAGEVGPAGNGTAQQQLSARLAVAFQHGDAVPAQRQHARRFQAIGLRGRQQRRATAGIALAAPPIASRLPGPRSLASVIAVTLAAQLGVAPVLVPTFGSVPAVSLPANLLAGPLVVPVTVWGLVAGAAAV